MEIRAHHLFCTRAYEGKGYSDSFSTNMERIIDRMKTENEFKLISSPDSICSSCPKLKMGYCESEDRIQKRDREVIELLNLSDSDYSYQDIERNILEKLTKKKFKEICRSCYWRKIKVCSFKKIISTRNFC